MIDYTTYTLQELEEAQRSIDEHAYPEQAAQLELLIRDRRRWAVKNESDTQPEHRSHSAPTKRSAAKKTPSLSTNQIVAIIAGALLLLVLLGVGGMWAMFKFAQSTGVAQTADVMFGDQHLKTVVALLELHKVRHGEYPESLDILDFTGEWDKIHIIAVTYCPSEDRGSYFVEVERGWIGKPSLKVEEEFWRGTGYDSTLGPCM